jgi:hypothetical protein
LLDISNAKIVCGAQHGRLPHGVLKNLPAIKKAARIWRLFGCLAAMCQI